MIEFRPLCEEDLPLLRVWLGRSHVRRWWTEPVDDEIAQGVDGRYLIVADGREVGMIQTYPEEQGVAGVDLLIGEEDLLGKGLGAEVLARFAREVVFARPETTAVIATVEKGNRRSWRAFEKAGFRHLRDVEEEGRPHRLMRLDRE